MRDYARKQERPRKSKRKAVILILFFSITAVAFLAIFNHTHTPIKSKTKVIPSIPVAKSNRPAPDTKTAASPSVKYDFYQLLPKMSVNVPLDKSTTQH